MFFSFIQGAPEAPEQLEVVNLEKDSVTLRWKKPKSDGGSPIINYILEKREEFKDDWSKVKQLDKYILTHEVTGLVPDKKYYFRVSAKNSIGVGEPAELQEPVIPSRPVGKCRLEKELLLCCFCIAIEIQGNK